MEVVEIDTAESLEALRSDWEDLWERDPAAGPFQHPDWALAWRRRLCGERPWVIGAYQDGRLDVLLPLYIHVRRPGWTRQATLLGNGASDRLDLILADGAEMAKSAVLARLLQRRTAVWDCCDFRDLPANAHLLELAAIAGGAATLSADEPTPVLDLRAAPKDLAGAPRRGLLANLRTARRRAERLGTLRFERATEETVDSAFDAFATLHSARWRERGEAGLLGDPATRNFQHDIAVAFQRRGWLRLHLLYLDAAAVAAIFAFQLRGRTYYYLGGFSPAHAAFSPGGLILEHAIGEAVREGASSFDFLRGREPYKYHWGARDRAQLRMQLPPARR